MTFTSLLPDPRGVPELCQRRGAMATVLPSTLGRGILRCGRWGTAPCSAPVAP
ncbi:hypothetical protein D516_0270 [Rhodobacter sp. AKP1]|nr:hypothetical protein D516_0270 [Rhodobacter sp. AKP1]